MARIASSGKIKRGDIWVTDLRFAVGQEVSKKRPALIISNNSINTFYPTVIAIPLSSQTYEVIGPERIPISREEGKLEKDSFILTTQMKAIDKTRLVKKISTISKQTLREVEEAVKLILDLDSQSKN